MSNDRRIAVFGRAELQPRTSDYRDAVARGRLGAVRTPGRPGLQGIGAPDENLLEWTIRAEGTRSAFDVLRDVMREGSLDGQIQR